MYSLLSTFDEDVVNLLYTTAYTASEVATGLYLQPRPKQYIVSYFGWSVDRLHLSQRNHKNLSVK
jgi:hypothetical protein